VSGTRALRPDWALLFQDFGGGEIVISIRLRMKSDQTLGQGILTRRREERGGADEEKAERPGSATAKYAKREPGVEALKRA